MDASPEEWHEPNISVVYFKWPALHPLPWELPRRDHGYVTWGLIEVNGRARTRRFSDKKPLSRAHKTPGDGLLMDIHTGQETKG